jgi:hypothetical protein
MNQKNKKHSLKLVKVALSLSADEPTGQQQQQGDDGGGGSGARTGRTERDGTREVLVRQWLKICRKSSRC